MTITTTDWPVLRDQELALGGFELESGETLPDARLAYVTHGTLNEAGTNAILFPHMYSGTTASLESYVGEGKALDPTKYFIVFPAQFGNGESSSPSNTPAPLDRGRFPGVSIGDDVRAQRLLLESLGVKRLELVLGWSMGAQQTYEWAVRYPEFVERIVPIAGTARTSPSNRLFVETHQGAIRLDPAFQGGEYAQSSDVAAGLRHHAHVFAATGASKALYDEAAYRELGFEDQDAFVSGFWEAWFGPLDPNNLLALADKWKGADVSRHTDGDLAAALGRITAKTLIIGFDTDWFFTVDDLAGDAALIPDAQVRVLDTAWGHFAPFGLTENDRQFFDATLKEALAL